MISNMSLHIISLRESERGPTGVKLPTHPRTEQKELKCDFGCSCFRSRRRWVLMCLTVQIILLLNDLYFFIYFVLSNKNIFVVIQKHIQVKRMSQKRCGSGGVNSDIFFFIPHRLLWYKNIYMIQA